MPLGYFRALKHFDLGGIMLSWRRSAHAVVDGLYAAGVNLSHIAPECLGGAFE